MALTAKAQRLLFYSMRTDVDAEGIDVSAPSKRGHGFPVGPLPRSDLLNPIVSEELFAPVSAGRELIAR